MEQVTQSTCNKLLQVLQYTSSSANKTKISIVANWNPYLNAGSYFFLGRSFLTPNVKEGIAIVWGGRPYRNQDETLHISICHTYIWVWVPGLVPSFAKHYIHYIMFPSFEIFTARQELVPGLHVSRLWLGGECFCGGSSAALGYGISPMVNGTWGWCNPWWKPW